MSMKSDELAKQLIEKDVDVEALHIMYAGADQILGEVVPDGLVTDVDGALMVEDPKRVLRIQQVMEGGVAISLMIGDMDFMSSGHAVVIPQIHYPVLSQPEETKVAVFEAYLEYFKRKTINKAKEAGIVLPQSVASPFRKG